MKGYKGMSKDMTCRGMHYEVGKTYEIDGNIELCSKGLHFCENLKDVFDYYSNDDKNRFFEVEAIGEVISENNKSVTNKLKVVRELSKAIINRCYYGNGYGDGDGYGYGNGNGYGYGNGNGYGYGYGNGYGDSNGYCDGYGYSNGNGYCDGYGDGNGIQKILSFK